MTMWASRLSGFPGLLVVRYERRILFANPIHREWHGAPGCRNSKSSSILPSIIAQHMSYKYSWSVLKSQTTSSGSWGKVSFGMHTNLTGFLPVISLCSSFPRGPLYMGLKWTSLKKQLLPWLGKEKEEWLSWRKRSKGKKRGKRELLH